MGRTINKKKGGKKGMGESNRVHMYKRLLAVLFTVGIFFTLVSSKSVEAATVIFNSMGGTSVANKTVNDGAQVGTLPTPDKPNSYFEGWYTAATGGSRVYSSTIVRSGPPRTYTVVAGNWPEWIFVNHAYNKGFTGTRAEQERRFRVVNGWSPNAYPQYIYVGDVIIVQDPNLANTVTYYARWSPGITIKFNGNGGTTPKSIVAKSGQAVGSLPKPTRDNHEFRGWFTTSAATGGTQLTTNTVFNKRTPKTYTIKAGDSWNRIALNQLGSESLSTQLASWNGMTLTTVIHPGQVIYIENPATIVSEYTYYARWQRMRVIHMDGNYGNVGIIATWSGEDGEEMGELPAPTRTGYTLKGWYTSRTGGTQITAKTKATSDTTYYAQWTKKSYKIIYNSNGGTATNPATKTVQYQDSLPAFPTAPTRTGYTFQGWGWNKTEVATNFSTYKMDPWDIEVYAIWKVSKHKYTFNPDGGVVSVSSIERDYGTQLGTLPIPTRTGYTYKGWFTGKGGTGTEVKYNTLVKANTTVYARWVAHVKATFDTNGVSVTPSYTSKVYDAGSKLATLPSVSSTGRVFNGWYTAKTGGTKVSINTIISANTTYYAQWTLNKYALKFSTNGGTAVAAQTVNYGTVVTNLPTTTRSGYTFNGWYTAASGGTKVTSVTVTADTTLYAQWSVTKYTVIFNSNGGTSVPVGTYTPGQHVGTLPKPTRSGYTLIGWFTAKTGGTRVNTYTPVVGNVTFYAQWKLTEIPDVTVTFNSNGGSTVSSKKMKPGSPVGELPTPTKSKAYFEGWYTSLTGGTKISETTVVNANVTYYARWESGVDYTKDANGGLHVGTNLEVETRTHKKGTVLNIYGNDPKREHYNFMGWYTARTGGTRIGTNYTINTDVTHYAQWTLKNYTVRFMDGTKVLRTVSVKYNNTIGQLTTPTKTGYVFKGWYTASQGGTKVNTSTRILGDTTFYAQWIADLIVTFNPNGGVTPSFSSAFVAVGGKVGELPVTSRSGYTFNGWYTAASGGTRVTVNTIVTQSTTYYAQWLPDLTVNFNSQGGSSVESQKVKIGGTLIDIPVPVRTGYVFNGWYTQPEGKGTRLTTTTKITDSVTYYASWSKLHTILFDVQGGTGENVRREIVEGNTVGALPITNKEGYRFNGWFTLPNGEGDKVVATRKPAKDETYFAHFVEQVTVNFIARNELVETRVLDINTAIGSLPNYEREGAIFKGWQGSSSDEFITEGTIITEDINFVAILNTLVTVTFDTQSGTPIQPITMESGTLLPNISKPTREDYTFRGWFTSPGGVGASFREGVPVYEDITLYAYWTNVEYVISFETNGGTYAEPLYVVIGDTVGLDQITTRVGHRFEGWYTEADLINKVPNQYKPTKSIRLFAKWYKVPIYELTYNTNVPGMVIPPKYVNEDTAIDRLAEPSRVGYGFLGWYADANFTRQVYQGYIPTQDMVLHAKWVKLADIVNVTIYPENGDAPVIRQGVKGQKLPASYYLTPYRDNSQFSGWFTQQYGRGTQVTRDTIYTQNTNVFAHWVDRDDYSEGKVPSDTTLLPNLNPEPWVPNEIINDLPGVEVGEDVVDTIYNNSDVIKLDEAKSWLESVSSVTKSDGYVKDVVFGDEGARSVLEPVLNSDDFVYPTSYTENE